MLNLGVKFVSLAAIATYTKANFANFNVESDASYGAGCGIFGCEQLFAGEEWEANSAIDKFNAIEEQLIASPEELTPIEHETMRGLFIESHETTVSLVADDMPLIPGFGIRVKYIHTQGLIAPVRWIAEYD